MKKINILQTVSKRELFVVPFSEEKNPHKTLKYKAWSEENDICNDRVAIHQK